jgi:hypothetical protein
MGLSFSSYRKELSSHGFKRAYEGMRAECPELFTFADPGDLIAFFHDQAADLDRKDAILFDLVTRYRNDNRHRDIAPLFIVLFTPALASIYTHARRRHSGIDREDLIQDLCLFLIQIIRESAITPYKVAGRIVGELRNRIRGLLKLIPDEEFVAVKGDGTDTFEAYGTYAAAGDSKEFPIDRIVHETAAFLDRLIRARKITKQDKRMIMETLVKGKRLKDVVSPGDYDRLKHRRLRIIRCMKEHFTK